jgi:hypothetical protein
MTGRTVRVLIDAADFEVSPMLACDGCDTVADGIQGFMIAKQLIGGIRALLPKSSPSTCLPGF